MINRKNILAVILLLGTLVVKAEIKLPAIFNDGMVLQQNTKANIWGTASPNAKVRIMTAWDKKLYIVYSDVKGEWKVTLDTPSAGGPYNITFNDGAKKVLNNILIGDVWLCSGQSNMEMPMKGFKNQPVENVTMDLLKSTNNQIRLFTMKRSSSLTPKSDVIGEWVSANPETVREFSATAYYFGKIVQEHLNIPIALVVASWGGSSCEAWMKSDWLKAFPEVKIPENENQITSKNRNPTLLYNGMLSPIIGMSIKGVIWYQGEDNYNRASNYAELFATLINGWRKDWKNEELPFYYCQIAPYDYSIITSKGQKVINSAYLREQQAMVEHKVNNTGMVVLLDAGMKKGIHPAKKKVVGERLARLALVKTYGVKGITAESPFYSGMEVKNDTVIVTFERAPMWVNCKDKFESDNFTIAGEDKIFYPAKAWIERSKVFVTSSQVKTPVAVRYGFENYVDGDLFGEDLPISSFRSDNW